MTKFDLSTMSRKEKYSLACQIISEISNEWTTATEGDDSDSAAKWQEDNVEEYESSMSFDELAAEVRAVNFK